MTNEEILGLIEPIKGFMHEVAGDIKDNQEAFIRIAIDIQAQSNAIAKLTKKVKDLEARL